MLNLYGWSEALRRDFAPYAAQGLAPARVILQQRGRYGLVTHDGEVEAGLAGKLIHDAPPGGLPVAGDFVAVRPDAIRHVLPRRTAFVRKAAGTGEAPQVVAANMDLVFVVAGLDADFNLRRLERHLAAAWESGAEPVVLLTKADACPDAAALVQEARAVAVGADVHAVSAATGEGLGAVRERLAPGVTAALIGMSGVGKSTLVNALLGEARLAVGGVRAGDGRGRHTTTHRELVRLPQGGLILDSPGIRELAFWGGGEGAASAFADVEALAEACRFRDCRHDGEPGCAVTQARAAGALDEARWRSYAKLRKELEHAARSDDPLAQQAWRKRWIPIAKANRRRYRERWSDAEE